MKLISSAFLRTALPFLFLGMLRAEQQPFRAGAAAIDITPPADMPFHVPQRPPYPVVIAEGVHDPLYVKAVVFESGGVKAAVVACDVTSLPGHMITEARQHIAKISKVPPENVLISAVHVHSAPNIWPRFFENGTPHQKKVAMDYIARLPVMIAESVQKAEANLTTVRLQAASGKVEGIAFNRRFFMKDGTVVANPHKGHDELLGDVVRAAGPTDPALPLLYLAKPDGTPVASVINFALHLDTVGGYSYSADFPFEICRILADVKGPGMLTLFTLGACGNINHYYLLDPQRPWRTKGYQEAARIGSQLAAEVVRLYQQTEEMATAPLKVSHEIVRVNMLEERAPLMAQQYGDQTSIYDGQMQVTKIDGKYTMEADVMVITIGNEVAFVGLPGEMFVELGLMIKQGSPYKYTIIDELANGSLGYIPNRKALSEGAYGASPSSTRCAPGTGEALADSAIRQLIAHRAMQPTP